MVMKQERAELHRTVRRIVYDLREDVGRYELRIVVGGVRYLYFLQKYCFFMRAVKGSVSMFIASILIGHGCPEKRHSFIS